MGSKSAAKALMERAGVPLVPGYHGDDQDPALLAARGRRDRLPRADQGQRRRRRQGHARRRAPGRLRRGARAGARARRAPSFGDDRVLVERYLTRPRHIEIQVFADRHGNVVHLFERDCSIQRRHQKVSRGSAGARHDRGAPRGHGRRGRAMPRARSATRAPARSSSSPKATAFYFMEMNTRLQVEHPVTEMITGQDLVEWQLRVADGRDAAADARTSSRINGHAIEVAALRRGPRARLPAQRSARCSTCASRAESAHVRVDTGVRRGRRDHASTTTR